MPEIWDRCVEEIKLKMKKGEMPKTYINVKTGKRLASSPYKICSFLLKDEGIKKLKKDERRIRKYV